MRTEKISLVALKKKIDTAKFFRTEIFISSKSLFLYRDYAGRQIRTILKKKDNGLYELISNYNYVNKLSHYDYSQNEPRFNRNKTIISSIIKRLKKSGVWKYIDKSFLVLNTNNERLTTKQKRVLTQELEEWKSND